MPIAKYRQKDEGSWQREFPDRQAGADAGKIWPLKIGARTGMVIAARLLRFMAVTRLSACSAGAPGFGFQSAGNPTRFGLPLHQ